jgi:vacuolar-type H+-ATPase subunit H
VSVQAQAQALLDLIAADRDRRCDEIMAGARRQAAELLRQAHDQARERVTGGLRDARARARHRVDAAAAQRQSRLRLAQQGSASDFLARAMALLPAALSARWQQSETRLRWVRLALLQARQALPCSDWRIAHAPGLLPADIAALDDDDTAPFLRNFEAEPQLVAGLRVHGNGNCVDASLAGLLADRDSLSASLLRAREVQS